MKMAEYNGHFENAKTNYELLWDVETCQGWLASYPIWKLCKGYISSHKGEIPSYVISFMP